MTDSGYLNVRENGVCHFQAEGFKYLSIFLPLIATVGLYIEDGIGKELEFPCPALGGESPSNIHISLSYSIHISESFVTVVSLL